MKSIIKIILIKLNRTKKYFFNLFLSEKERWLFFYKFVEPQFNNIATYSNMPIDVVILSIEKDLETLPLAIDSVRRNVNHPISNIYIISPISDPIQQVCLKNKCVFINEKDILDLNANNLDFTINGVNRSKWIYQQLLKMDAGKITKEKHYLVLDADTVFVRPQVFEHKGKMIVNFSDEFHKPYRVIYKKLFLEKTKAPVSFVCHHMVFEQDILSELKQNIEKNTNSVWYNAIIKAIDIKEGSGFSEYETYGQYIYSHYRSNIKINYWYNLSLTRDKLQNLDNLEKLYGKKYKSISFHSYNK